jgi:sulfate-transporting ATPase
MTTVIQYALLGLGVSAAYTLLAQGLVLVYRGSGVLNFAHAAFALLAAFVYFECRTQRGWAVLPALLVSTGLVTLMGAAVYQGVMRPLRSASGITRAVATLGMLILIQGVVVVVWGPDPQSIEPLLPTKLLEVGGVAIGVDKLILFAIAAMLTAALWATTRFSALGLALRATAENPTAAASLGWSPHMLGTVTWSVGAGLAGIAGILIAPLTAIDATVMPLLVIPVLAAALLGSLSSFPLTFLAAVAIGIGQAEMAQYVDIKGLSTALPFLIIIVYLVVRGRGLPARAFVTEQLPEVGIGRIRPLLVVPVVAAVSLLTLFVFPAALVDALIVTFAWGMILLSVVVLLGYTGQLSLAQFAFGGVGALIAGRMAADWGLSFPAALVLAMLVTIPIGALLALPALRTRGIDLAVVTLGISVSISAMVFTNASITGGTLGIATGERTLFGLNINPILYPERYALLAFLLFVVCGLAIANLRRSPVGRRLIAVRTNERAAAALGVSVFKTKLYAFALATGIAAIGGIVLAFKDQTIILETYDPIQSVLALAYAIVGGVGFIVGGFFGATLVAGSFGSWLLNQAFPNANPAWLNVVGGVAVILLVIGNQNGIVSEQIKQIQWIARMARRLARRPDKPRKAPVEAMRTTAERARIEPATLEARNVTVRFGGVTAVNDASFEIRPGEVLGLIGPNGAGKTTMIDAITGFVRPAEGDVLLNGNSMAAWSVHKRSHEGLSRSFQSLELFETSTVRENLSVAGDRSGAALYVTSLVAPRATPLSPAAAAAVEELGLTEHLDEVVQELPYGVRRLVAIARAAASGPSILLLDEPAAGLSGTEVSELMGVIRGLAERWGMGILLVEHDMTFVMAVCDRITVLDFGRQIATGTPEEIRTDPTVIAAYLGEEQESATPAKELS